MSFAHSLWWWFLRMWMHWTSSIGCHCTMPSWRKRSSSTILLQIRSKQWQVFAPLKVFRRLQKVKNTPTPPVRISKRHEHVNNDVIPHSFLCWPLLALSCKEKVVGFWFLRARGKDLGPSGRWMSPMSLEQPHFFVLLEEGPPFHLCTYRSAVHVWKAETKQEMMRWALLWLVGMTSMLWNLLQQVFLECFMGCL